MEKSDMENRTRKKYGPCHHARLFGVLGLLIILWVFGYVIVNISEEPLLAIPTTIFWALMIMGALFDIVRRGKEGTGGLIVIIAGVGFYLFLLLKLVLGWKWARGGESVELVAALPLFAAGLLFHMCGRRRKSAIPDPNRTP